MQIIQNEELSDRVEKAAELYWLKGMDLGHAKRRALADVARDEMPQRAPIFPVVRL